MCIRPAGADPCAESCAGSYSAKLPCEQNTPQLEYDAAADCGEVIYEWEQTAKAISAAASTAA